MTTYENPMLAVDVVALRRGETELLVGTAPRQFEPHLGDLALPGVLMRADETVLDSASRALRTKLGVSESLHLAKGRVYDTPNRDERGPTVSIGCLAIVQEPGSPDVTWAPVKAIPSLPFDHNTIIEATLSDLGREIWRDATLMHALFGDTFTTNDASAVIEQINGAVPYGSTVRRQLANTGFLRERPGQPIGRGRPPTAWGFTDATEEPS